MGNLTRETIEALRSGTIAAEDEVLRIAGDLLGKANSQGGYISGFADTDAEEITQDEAEQLKQALAGLLAKTQDPDTVISVIWALGKSNDHGYKDLYVRYLHGFVDTCLWSSAGVSQVLCALQDIGQEVFEREEDGGWGHSVLDIEKNLRQARAYLQRLGTNGTP